MKAAVLYHPKETPRYISDFPEPVPASEDEILISVTAAAVKHIDRSKATGRHYSNEIAGFRPNVIGGDGVGVMSDGTRIFALGVSGMVAERAVVSRSRIISLPDDIDDATAAALPNAVAGSAMALRFRAGVQPGETVLINGATGFTGKTAVQIAKHYGAGKIIVTGRNAETLQQLRSLGADECISLADDDEKVETMLRQLHRETPVDIVIDYLWGGSAEMILFALKGNGRFSHRTRFVSVGAVTGSHIHLSSEMLRSTDLFLSGSGLGSWSKSEMQLLFSKIIPGMFALAAAGKLKADIDTIQLEDIGSLWNMELPAGRRMVVLI